MRFNSLGVWGGDGDPGGTSASHQGPRKRQQCHLMNSRLLSNQEAGKPSGWEHRCQKLDQLTRLLVPTRRQRLCSEALYSRDGWEQANKQDIYSCYEASKKDDGCVTGPGLRADRSEKVELKLRPKRWWDPAAESGSQFPHLSNGCNYPCLLHRVTVSPPFTSIGSVTLTTTRKRILPQVN